MEENNELDYKLFACIGANNTVENTVVFDKDVTNDFLESWKQETGNSVLIEVDPFSPVQVGWIFDGQNVVDPNPPVIQEEASDTDQKIFEWDQENQKWVVVNS